MTLRYPTQKTLRRPARTAKTRPGSKRLFENHPRLRAGWEALQELHGPCLADDHQGALDVGNWRGPPKLARVETLVDVNPDVAKSHRFARPANHSAR